MKNLILLITLFGALFSVNAQSNIDKDPDWGVGKIKTFKENKIKRIEGANSSETITNITYRSLKQLIEEVNSGALRGDAKKKQLKKYKDYSSGGVIVFYVNRKNEAAANLKNYTLILKNNMGEELYKRTYKDNAAKINKETGGWENSKNFELKVEVERPFIVEIYDNKTTYKFEVLE